MRAERHHVEVGGAARRGRSAPMGGSRGGAERPIQRRVRVRIKEVGGGRGGSEKLGLRERVEYI